MTALPNIFILLLLTSFLKVSGQFFEKTYTGQWAKTSWKFEFQKDGSYKRTSTGHFGNPTFQGRYKIYNDTIELANDYDSSSVTLNKYYLISTYYNKFVTVPKGRIIDLVNLYEYYDNNHNYISQKNKVVKIEIVDSLNIVAKSFIGYIPINYLTNKYQIDLSWCVEFCDYPQKFKKAYFEKPDKLDQKDRLFSQNIFNNDQMLIEYFYNDSLTSGTKPETMKLEYFHGTKNVKKIIDSKDASNYNFEYNNNGNIMRIGYYTVDNKMITILRITE
jgi:hypothetical protein